MIIETGTGRRRSVITDEEIQNELIKRMSSLNEEERFWLHQVFDQVRQMAEEGDEGYESGDEMASMAKILRECLHLHYEEPLVPVKEFILSERYFGHVGSYFYKTWFNDLIELNSKPFNEAILTGSIGSGKTTFADMGLAYMFYELCMLKDPQATFGLMPGSEIVLVCFNRDQTLAREVTFGGFKRKVEQSPFFKDLGLVIRDSLVHYKKKNIKVIPVSAKSANALGRDVFGGIIDETDFMDGSVIKEVSDTPGEKPFVEALHESIIRRMKSRFDVAGVLPGKLFMTSSARHKGSYTNRRIGEAATDPAVFCRDYAIYEVKPAEKFAKEKFWVRVGNERIPHKILSKQEYRRMGSAGRRRFEAQGCRFIRVPMNFKSDFERNIEDAIRDIAGVVTVSISPFFQLRGRVYEVTDTTMRSPVYVDEWCTSEPLEIDWERLVRKYRSKIGPGEYSEELRPIRHPSASRFVHLDLSLGLTDPAGICIAHIVDYITMERRGKDGEEYREEVPLIEVDLVLRVVAPPIGEIDFGEIRGLIYAFQKHGYTISFASMDSFQSRDMLQQLGNKGIDGEIISVDKTIDPYTCLKTAVYEGRLSVYDYPILIQEMEKLVRNDAKGKVDHPANGCFVGSTRVALSTGQGVPIESLEGKSARVLSSDKDGKLVFGKAKGRKTKEVSELIEITLDGGESERCTPEHPWRLPNGKYKKAEELKKGSALMFHGTGITKVRGVKKVTLKEPVPVYDLEVDVHNNFALMSGVFVHNSKDCADAVCGAVYALTTKEVFRAPMEPGISEYVDESDRDSEWIRQTMHKAGDKAPVEVRKDDYDGPVFFTG